MLPDIALVRGTKTEQGKLESNVNGFEGSWSAERSAQLDGHEQRPALACRCAADLHGLELVDDTQLTSGKRKRGEQENRIQRNGVCFTLVSVDREHGPAGARPFSAYFSDTAKRRPRSDHLEAVHPSCRTPSPDCLVAHRPASTRLQHRHRRVPTGARLGKAHSENHIRTGNEWGTTSGCLTPEARFMWPSTCAFTPWGRLDSNQRPTDYEEPCRTHVRKSKWR